MLKKVIVPVAALAITATSVSAFDMATLRNSDINLTEAQVSAMEEAQSLREEGASREAVEAVLANAGLDEDTMREIRDEAHAARDAARAAIDEALAAGDYDAFLVAIEGSPLAETIDTEAKFERFKEAHELMAEAKGIMEELGIERGGHDDKMMGGRGLRGEMREGSKNEA